MLIKIKDDNYLLQHKKCNIEINLIDEKIERAGGDGEWLRYITGEVLVSNVNDIKKNEVYVFILENYEIPNMVLDKNGIYYTSLAE